MEDTEGRDHRFLLKEQSLCSRSFRQGLLERANQGAREIENSVNLNLSGQSPQNDMNQISLSKMQD